MKRFIKDIKKFRHYLKYAAKSDLKSEVADSRLNWLWWILDPLCFMLVYTFISAIVFKQTEPYFPIFVFIGLTTWTFFNKAVQGSVKVVKKNKSIVNKVYIPKFIFILKSLLVNGFKMFISFVLVLILMLIYRVPVTWNVLFVIPITLSLVMLTFGFSTILLHIGVFVSDLANVMTIILRLIFYMSGIFYSLEKRVPQPYGTLMLKCNPIAGLINQYRESLLYSTTPEIWYTAVCFVIGLLISAIGIYIIYKNENNYVKVI